MKRGGEKVIMKIALLFMLHNMMKILVQMRKGERIRENVAEESRKTLGGRGNSAERAIGKRGVGDRRSWPARFWRA